VPGSDAARNFEHVDRPLAAFFESLPRESTPRGSFAPDEVAEILRRDRDDAIR
jgi:hypothetical protein